MGKRIAEHKSFLTRMQRRGRNARRLVYAALAWAAAWVLMRLPFPVLRAFCRVLVGGLAPRLHGRLAEQHLIAAFGSALTPERRREVLRLMFRNMADLPAEALAAAYRGPDFVRSRFLPGPGIAKWRALQAREGGMIGLTGHIGNWELLLQLCQIDGVRPVVAVAKRIPDPRLNRLVERSGGAFGVPTLYGDSGVTAIARVLARGETLGIVPDQDIDEIGGVFVEFLGRPAYTPIGPARLALATGATIVVAFAKRVGDRLEMIVHDPIEPDRGAPRDEEIVRLTRAWSALVEDFVREHPEQWMWLHDRWETVPDEVASRQVARCGPQLTAARRSG
ncbi:MAG TPA: lysophospholipid acyltransferase family protein [Planctomycetota bacterium]|nr:lysophospholipid acyltransferase family protein [Planctomycetota bacterium]